VRTPLLPRAATGAALALALAVALSGCTVVAAGPAAAGNAGPSSPPVARPGHAAEPYRDVEGRFGLVPPAGWTADADAGPEGTAVVFRAPSGSAADRFTANINVFVVPATQDLPAAVVGARRELTALSGYRGTRDEPRTLDDGSPAHLFGGTFTGPGPGPPLRNVQLFTVRDGLAVTVTGTSHARAWDVYAPVFEASLRTLTTAG
jgi:hypothetical protein